MRIKKVIFLITIILTFFINIAVIQQPVNAKAVQEKGWDEIIKQGDEFIQKGKAQVDKAELKKATTSIYNVLFAIGVVLTVLVAGFLGVQFIMASAEEKAQIKQKMIPFVLGCIIIFAAFGIWKLAVDVLSKLE